MARKILPLTATQVEKVKPKVKQFNLNDGDGLALRVKTNGSKLWFFNYYRPITRKRANLSLGKYPLLSIAKETTKAIEARNVPQATCPIKSTRGIRC
ncbi:MAG: integrase arm-type DNA-binding domain-containing protein [Psychromonas sp.]